LPFAQEAERRANAALKGTNRDVWDALVGTASKYSYLQYLTSFASAILQPASIYFNSIPILWGNYGSLTGAAKEISRAIAGVHHFSPIHKNPDGSISIVAPSLANDQTLPKHEQEAIREMNMRGVAQNTFASTTWDDAITPAYQGYTLGAKAARKFGAPESVLEVIDGGTKLTKKSMYLITGAPMHNLERLSREVTYLAAYRLGYKKYLKQGMTPRKQVKPQ